MDIPVSNRCHAVFRPSQNDVEHKTWVPPSNHHYQFYFFTTASL